ncbi:hypothetical protein Tco_0998972 [Tanacetum coccineum]
MQQKDSKNCVLEGKKVERNHSKKNEKEKKARPERGKKASSKVDELVIKRKKGRASYRKLASKKQVEKSDEQQGQGRRAESKRRKNDRDDRGRNQGWVVGLTGLISTVLENLRKQQEKMETREKRRIEARIFPIS